MKRIMFILAGVAFLAACGAAHKSKAVGVKAPPPSAICHYAAGGALPDVNCTPGAINPAVTQADIKTTICKVGWTATIRPSTSVTGPEKITSMKQYGVTNATKYEYDHLISLELGGAPNNTRNLWPEPHVVAGNQGSGTKDGIENKLKTEVCAHKLTLAAAQQIISKDWRKG